MNKKKIDTGWVKWYIQYTRCTYKLNKEKIERRQDAEGDRKCFYDKAAD